MKLSIRLPLFVGAVVLITASVIIITAEIIAANNLRESYNTEMAVEAELNAELIKARLDAQLGVQYELANRVRTRSMNWEAVRQSLAPDVERIGSLDIGLVFPNGTARYVTDDSTAAIGAYSSNRKSLVACCGRACRPERREGVKRSGRRH